MDILYLLAASYARGGIKICVEHCNRLAELGHNMRILSTSSPPDWIELKVPWELTDKNLGAELPRCDLVVFSFYEQAYLIRETVLASGAVPIYFVQGDEIVFGDPDKTDDDELRKRINLAQTSFRLPYPILTVSGYAARRIELLGGKKPAAVHNGVDRSVFRPTGPKKNDVPRILSVGSEFSRFKGIVEICGALMKLRREGMRFLFVRASPQPDGIGELEFPVEFYENPTQAQLARLYAEADVFVGASHQESFFLTPLEAMACGTAVVCSDLLPVREYAMPGEDFLAFPPGDVPALTRQLRRALRYPRLREQLVERGLRVAERMDWGQIIPRLEKYFANQLKRKKQIRSSIRAEIKNPKLPFKVMPIDT